MIIISHRANLNGPNPEKENRKSEINLRIREGYQVEIDVIGDKKGNLFLGHDNSQEKVDISWLEERSKSLWIHCKNKEALEIIHSHKSLNYFVHDKDMATITSKGYVWGYPGQKIKNSIFVMPEWENDDLNGALGICTDFPQQHKKTNYTLVIQGPVEKRTKTILEKYQYQHDNIIFSTWSSPELTKLKKEFDFKHIQLIENELPPVTKNINNQGLIYYQCCSSLNGMEHVLTDYAIKLRSDEYYSDLSPIINLFDKTKIVTNDIHSSVFSRFPFHISDHLMAGKTSNLLGLFKSAHQILTSPREYNKVLHFYKMARSRFKSNSRLHNNSMYSEGAFALSYFKYKNIPLNRKTVMSSKDTFKQLFHFVPTSELGDHLLSSHSTPITYEYITSKRGHCFDINLV